MTEEFRDWLGSEAATQQLSQALAESAETEERCTQCEEPIEEWFSYYGVEDSLPPMCADCGRVWCGLD